MNKLGIFLFLIIIPAVCSVTKEDINLEAGESIVVGGRNFTLVFIGSNNMMLMKIDNKEHILSTNKTEYINGIYIYPGDYYEETRWHNKSIDLNISMNYTCGNSRCETSWENSENCCIDCNCSANYTCYEKKCVKSEFIQCYRDSDCKDENECTKDYCAEFPKRCYHDKIIECRHGDGCCPLNCTAIDDEDCYVEKPKCKTDADCNDDNANTIDKCSKMTSWCFYTLNETKEKVEVDEITGKTVIAVENKGLFRKLLDWFRELFE